MLSSVRSLKARKALTESALLEAATAQRALSRRGHPSSGKRRLARRSGTGLLVAQRKGAGRAGLEIRLHHGRGCGRANRARPAEPVKPLAAEERRRLPAPHRRDGVADRVAALACAATLTIACCIGPTEPRSRRLADRRRRALPNNGVAVAAEHLVPSLAVLQPKRDVEHFVADPKIAEGQIRQPIRQHRVDPQHATRRVRAPSRGSPAAAQTPSRPPRPAARWRPDTAPESWFPSRSHAGIQLRQLPLHEEAGGAIDVVRDLVRLARRSRIA